MYGLAFLELRWDGRDDGEVVGKEKCLAKMRLNVGRLVCACGMRHFVFRDFVPCYVGCPARAGQHWPTSAMLGRLARSRQPLSRSRSSSAFTDARTDQARADTRDLQPYQEPTTHTALVRIACSLRVHHVPARASSAHPPCSFLCSLECGHGLEMEI